MTQEIAAPVIHVGGTHPDALLVRLSDASNALFNASKAIRETAPNARDYVHPTASFMNAVEQHNTRLQAILNIQRELAELAALIDNQKK